MFHFVTYAAIVAVIIGSIVNLVNSSKENLYSASLLVVVSLILASLAWFGRRFALKAQDRAIRAEENFRHFILTGRPLDHRLRMGQIYDMKQRRTEAIAAYKKAIAYAPEAEAAQESKKYLSTPYRRL